MEIYWMTSLLLLECMLHYNNSCESKPHRGSNNTPLDVN